MCGSVIPSSADKMIYTPDGDQSISITKGLLMKMYNDGRAKKEVQTVSLSVHPPYPV